MKFFRVLYFIFAVHSVVGQGKISEKIEKIVDKSLLV